MSLWPLAVALFVGAAIVVIAILGASRASLLGGADHREDYLLDDLTNAARLVTPTGGHEVRLSRLPACQQGDSADSKVERELSFNRTFDKATMTDEIISAYVRGGWSRNAFAPHDGTASRDVADGNIRGVRVEAEPGSRAVYIDVSDTTFIC
jgi:hypothetical protein